MLRRTLFLNAMKWRLKRKSATVLPHFDMCVIGSGPAGFAAAMRATDYGKKVCIVEKGRIGGTDIWDGTLQSKSLWEMSHFLTSINEERIRRIFNKDDLFDAVQISDEKMHNSLTEVAEKREAQILQAITTANVKLLKGAGAFVNENELSVYNADNGEYYNVTADYMVIATGSKPRQHSNFLTNGTSIITTDEIMRQNLPESIVIVGAGVIGCEFASMLASLRRTKVNIIDKKPRVLSMEDEDISNCIQNHLEKKGVTIHHDARLFDMVSYEDKGKERVQYSVKNIKTNKLSNFDVERALISIGRTPNLRGLDLENTKCKIVDGNIIVDEFQCCNPRQNIFAVGDVTTDPGVISVGIAKGRFVVDHIYGSKQLNPVDTTHMSRIYFTEPAVAAVGLNEQQCRAAGIAHVVGVYGYEFVSRAVAMGQVEGFIKIICTNDDEKRILGTRAVGLHSSTIVELVSMAISRKQSAHDLIKIMTAYPAITQGYQECLRMICGRSIMKPNVFPQLTLRTWVPSNIDRGVAYSKL